MAELTNAPAITDLDELLEYREITERISAFLVKRLRDHLATLWPLLTAGRVLGKHVGARDTVTRADEALAELAAKYKLASGSPLDLKQELDEEVLSAVGSVLKVYPLEYHYEAKGSKATKRISMTSPVRWVVTYGSEYSLSEFRNVLTGTGDRRLPTARQFVVNALVFGLVLSRNSAVVQLLKDLRWEMEIVPLPGFDKLPVVTLGVPVQSFRPADDMLLTAVRLSGVPAFIELINTDAVHNMKDNLRSEIEALLQEST